MMTDARTETEQAFGRVSCGSCGYQTMKWFTTKKEASAFIGAEMAAHQHPYRQLIGSVGGSDAASRAATDEEARTAGERVVEQRRELLKNLADR